MGSFYATVLLRDASTDAIREWCIDHERRASVMSDGPFTLVADGDALDESVATLAEELSRDLSCLAMSAYVYDDDLLIFNVFRSGRLADHYRSQPGNPWDGTETAEVGPSGGKPGVLAAIFGGDNAAIDRVLHAEYVLESWRHHDLLELLSLPGHASSFRYRHLARGDSGHDPSDFTQT